MAGAERECQDIFIDDGNVSLDRPSDLLLIDFLRSRACVGEF